MIRLLPHLFIFISCLLLITSCKDKKQGTHVIKIDIANLPDTMVYFDELSFSNTSIIDSGRSNRGELVFSKNLNPDYFYEIVIGGFIIPIIADNDRIIISGDWNDMNQLKVKGSRATASILAFEHTITDYNNCIAQETSLRLTDKDLSVQTELPQDENSLLGINELKKYIKSYADTVSNLQAAVYAIRNLDPVRDVVYFQNFASTLKKRFPTNILADSFSTIINSTLKQIKGNMVKIGQKAPIITAMDTAGKSYTVNFQNKYTLIDFWASWCPPCRTENPQLVATYRKWAKPQIQFVSVSLDRDISKWKSAISEDQLLWINLVDTLEWEAAAVKDYGFDRIPTNILVDPKGKIIAINLFGLELDEAMKQYIP